MNSASSPWPRHQQPIGALAAVLLPLLLWSCTGTVAAPELAVGTRPAAASCPEVSPGPSPLRRLTRFEYNNTVRDLVGDTTRPADALPPEEVGNGFGNDANALSVSAALSQGYFDIAHDIAARLVADPERLSSQLGCAPDVMGEEACAQSFIARFARRAYRRPPAPDELEALARVYTKVRALPGQDFRSSIAAVVEASLQMPQFLYRLELDPSTSAVARVDGYAMASRLSYLLWGSMPDDALLAAAEEGRLGSPGDIRAQAERLLKDRRARDVVRYFHGTLFGLMSVASLSRDPARFPGFTPEVPPLLQEETLRFLDDVVWEGAGDLASMLTATHSFRNARLAAFYDASATDAPAGESFQRVELDPRRAAGVLTQASLMAALTPGSSQTNPVLRGRFVLTQLLCESPPPPPQGFTPTPPPPDTTLTTRERFAAHSRDATCAACHVKMDPLGFAFEHYDQVGRWRDVDNGKPVDSSGALVGTDVPGPFADAVQLAGRLSQSDQVKRCMVAHWLTFAYGRVQTEADACTQRYLETAFAASGGRIRDLLLALTQTDAFLYRTSSAP